MNNYKALIKIRKEEKKVPLVENFPHTHGLSEKMITFMYWLVLDTMYNCNSFSQKKGLKWDGTTITFTK